MITKSQKVGTSVGRRTVEVGFDLTHDAVSPKLVEVGGGVLEQETLSGRIVGEPLPESGVEPQGVQDLVDESGDLGLGIPVVIRDQRFVETRVSDQGPISRVILKLHSIFFK